MKILLIEDEEGIINFLKTSLKEHGYLVDIAKDGEEGSQLAMSNDYDLIIIDYFLPKKNGDKICEEIRKAGKNTPILFLTVKSELETKVDLLSNYADDYLVKPFQLDELLARIKALLRRPQAIEKNVVVIDDLIIDISSDTVKRGEQEIYLTLKEMGLLKYMLKNKNRVLSRSMIMENVWDGEADPFSNTIETHILNLRKKIDTDKKKKLIHTVSGRGYKIGLCK